VEYAARCAQTYAPAARITADEMSRLDQRFWIMFWDIYRLLLRGDIYKGYTIYLELLHFTLPTLLAILPPEDPGYQGLIVARYGPDAGSTLAHLRALLKAYEEARAAVIRRTNVGYMPNSAFEQAIKRLIDRSR
jgi:hypothetical protein